MEIIQEDIKASRDELSVTIIDGIDELLSCSEFWSALQSEAPECIPESSVTHAESRDTDDVDLSAHKALYRICDHSGEVTMRAVSSGSTLALSDVNDSDIHVVTCENACWIHIGCNASKDERIFVRMHLDNILRACDLPHNTRTTFVRAGDSGAEWNALFA